MVAFVIWVVSIAFIYALVQSQAQSGALAGVVRVAALRTVVFAGQSALAEACHVLRTPAARRGSSVMAALEGGRSSGIVHDPEATRAKYAEAEIGGAITIDPVNYEIVYKPPPESTEAWQIDLTVRVRYDVGGSRSTGLARTVRRRHTGRLITIRNTLGPQAPRDVLTRLFIWGDPLLEVVEP